MKVFLALVLVASLTACGAQPAPKPQEFKMIMAKLPDGRAIPCLVWLRGNVSDHSAIGGIDCDWHADD